MVSFIDDFVSRADADAFEAMLQGTTPPSPAMSDLLSLTQQVASVPIPGPDPSFVTGLAATLRTEAAAVAASPPTSSAPAPATQPSVLTIHGTWPKVLAGAAAGVVVAGTGLGVASQGALPGDALYAVRGVVDGLEVRLAGSDGAQGRTLLAHAREHVADTSALADRTPQVADDIRTSLSDAAASVESGQTELFAAFDDTREPDHLRVVQEFTSWVQPQLQTLRQKLPAEALGELAALQSTVDKGTTELRAKLVACGESCSGIAVPAPRPSATTSPPSSTTAPPSTSPSPPSPSSPTTIPPLLTSPGATVTVPAPSVPTTPGRTTRPQRPTTVPDEPRPRPTTDPTRTRTPRPTVPRPTTTDADPTPTRSTSTPTPSGPRPCPPRQVWVPLPGTDLGTCLPRPKVPTVTATIVLPPVVVPPVVVPDAPDVTVPDAPDAPDLPGAPEPDAPDVTVPAAPDATDLPGAPEPDAPDVTAPAAPEPSEPAAPEPPVTPPAETATPLPSIPTSAAPGLPGPTAPAPTTTSAEPTPTATTTEPTPTQTTPAPTTPAPSDTPTGVLVTPEAPRFADHCVPGNGIVHLPRTTGVSYEWDRRIGLITTTVVVDATPEPGYAFAPGTTSRWTRDYAGICGRD